MVAASTEAADWMKMGSEKDRYTTHPRIYLSVGKLNKYKPKASYL
jgi:hypothetical protein